MTMCFIIMYNIEKIRFNKFFSPDLKKKMKSLCKTFYYTTVIKVITWIHGQSLHNFKCHQSICQFTIFVKWNQHPMSTWLDLSQACFFLSFLILFYSRKPRRQGYQVSILLHCIYWFVVEGLDIRTAFKIHKVYCIQNMFNDFTIYHYI